MKNSGFELCRGLTFSKINYCWFVRLTYSFQLLFFVLFPKMHISVLTSQESSQIFWKYFFRTLSQRVQGKKFISNIHKIFIDV